jgi:outer membrane receptor for Fe3+-dicitrate
MNVTKATRLRTLVVQDPISKEGVELTAYRDPVSGSFFAVDDTFIEQVSVFIPSIYNSGTLQLDEDDEANRDKTSRRLPVSSWPGGDDSAESTEYAVTITVDVTASSFSEAKRAFLAALAGGAPETAIFHVEHLRSGIVQELD